MNIFNSDIYARLKVRLETAVLDGTEWSFICDDLATLLGGVGASIDPADPGQRGPWCVHSESLRENVEEYYNEGWQTRDLRPIGFEIARRQGFVTDLDFVPPHTMKRHPYYTEFLKRRKLGLFLGIHFKVDERDWMISVQRPENAAPPEDELLAQIPRLQSVITNTVREASALASTKLEGWLSGFDDAGRGIAIIRHDGKLSRMNAEAERLLSSFDLLKQLQISLPDSNADKNLRILIDKVARNDLMDQYPPPIILQTGERSVLIFEVFKFPKALRQFFLFGSGILVVRGGRLPEADMTPDLSRFALSPAEVRVAIAIASGKTTRDISEHTGLMESTIRQQLKSVLRKTGVHKQAQLIALLRNLT